MRNFFSYICVGCLAVMLGGCVETVELDAPRVEEELVIYGNLHAGLGRNEVQIAYTQEFGTFNIQEETGATVFFIDGDGEKFTCAEEGSGIYAWINEDRPVRSGEVFTLEVTTAAGVTYRSTPETVPAALPIRNIYFELNDDVVRDQFGNEFSKTFMDIFVDVDLRDYEGSPLLRWQTFNAYTFREIELPTFCPPQNPIKRCYIDDGITQPEDVLILDSKDVSRGEVKGIWVGRKPFDSTFNDLNIFRVFQRTLTSTGFTYWENQAKVFGQGGSIFDSAPTSVRGNIVNQNDPDDQVLGNFEVFSADTAMISMNLTDLNPAIPPQICQFRRCNVNGPCIACEQFQNSSTIKPDYFP